MAIATLSLQPPVQIGSESDLPKTGLVRNQLMIAGTAYLGGTRRLDPQRVNWENLLPKTKFLFFSIKS